MSIAVDQLKSAYDEVPYASYPFPQTAPEHLAAVAHLFGLEAPPVATARVLELGCSSGGNLVPFAARSPGAQVLGVDLSGVQIGIGRKRIEALGLTNIALVEADLSALDTEALGRFDYIICHGVYSWVPSHVQDAILRICRKNLAPDGVAYISYNVYPGWKTKEVIRDAMMLRGGPRNTAAERLSYGKGMLDFLEQVAPKDSVLARILQATLPDLRNQRDYYLSHEYLEPVNSPCYFKEFISKAEGHGLAYLAEAQPSGMFVANYGEQIAGPLLKECGHSQVLLEQYLDFIVNRTFRQTLLAHGERAAGIRYRLDGERLRKLHYAAHLTCRDGDLRLDSSSQRFGDDGSVFTLHSPEAKAAVHALSAAWPETLSYDQILQQAAGVLNTVGKTAVAAKVEDVLEFLVIKGLVRIRPAPVYVAAAEDPIGIDRAIRKTAELSRDEGSAMTFNAWHEPVPLGVVEAWLLPELDGTRDRDALRVVLREWVRQGKIAFERQGTRVVEPVDVEECIAEHLLAMPSRLAASKLVSARVRRGGRKSG
jgi:methyltransferase-like protein/2-polyprenyl-3-methyl-5-hydroxy-6-metoxy-1,4-benzoquinol methylase